MTPERKLFPVTSDAFRECCVGGACGPTQVLLLGVGWEQHGLCSSHLHLNSYVEWRASPVRRGRHSTPAVPKEGQGEVQCRPGG